MKTVSRFCSAARRLIYASIACLILLSAYETPALAQECKPPIPLPSPFTPIVDYANVIDPDTEAKLGNIYLNLKERTQIEFAVVTVDTTGDQDIFDFSLAIGRCWGIGPREGEKNGFVLVAAIKDRKYYTQVSYHLEGDLPDGLVGQIQRERLVPAFRQGNYGKGIYDTIQAYVATLAAKRGFSIDGIDQRYAYRDEAPQPSRTKSSGLGNVCCTALVILFVIILLISAGRRGGRGGRGGGSGGWWNLLLLGSLLNAGSGRSSGSGWSGGGFGGGGFGGGGGGFGGGFGGGGSFGGGGAGGSW